MTPSNSSMISHHAYDEQAQRLTLTFRKGGNVVHYDGVLPATYQAFSRSPSHGSFFHQRIKGRHAESTPS